MPDGPDPLDRRALFWAPAQRRSDDRRPDEPDPARSLGKRALFSVNGGAAVAPSGAAGSQAPRERHRGRGGDRFGADQAAGDAAPPPAHGDAPGAAGGDVHGHPSMAGTAHEHAPHPAGTAVGAPGVGDAGGPGGRPWRARHLVAGDAALRAVGPVHLACASCGAHSEVDVVRFVLLHVPFWLWRPGKGYARFMTCPACRRRTWISASWAPWRSSGH